VKAHTLNLPGSYGEPLYFRLYKYLFLVTYDKYILTLTYSSCLLFKWVKEELAIGVKTSPQGDKVGTCSLRELGVRACACTDLKAERFRRCSRVAASSTFNIAPCGKRQ
jgi:hypothetical protein